MFQNQSVVFASLTDVWFIELQNRFIEFMMFASMLLIIM